MQHSWRDGSYLSLHSQGLGHGGYLVTPVGPVIFLLSGHYLLLNILGIKLISEESLASNQRRVLVLGFLPSLSSPRKGWQPDAIPLSPRTDHHHTPSLREARTEGQVTSRALFLAIDTRGHDKGAGVARTLPRFCTQQALSQCEAFSTSPPPAAA